ncbi:MAG: hypothetical protein ACYDC3_02470 [Candidatus Binataceae bacterium]
MDAYEYRQPGRALRKDLAVAKPTAGKPPMTGLAGALPRGVVRMVAMLTIVVFAASCTSMGIDHPALRDSISYGPPENVRLCVLLDDGITQADADSLLESWNDEAKIYNLYLQPVSYTNFPREGFFHTEILEQVNHVPLGKSCDRVLYFVNRNVGDVAFGLISVSVGVPEILGEVDDATLTHGYVVARRATINQLLMTPSGVTEHELFHLLGCPNHFDMPDCYTRIHNLKLAEEKLKAQDYFAEHNEIPFYPTFASRTDSMLITRSQVLQYQRFDGETGAAAISGY